MATNQQNIEDLFTAINQGINLYQTLTGEDTQGLQFDDEQVKKATEALDKRADNVLDDINAVFSESQNAFGVPTSDAIQDYYTRFDDVIRDQFARGTDKLENFNPDLTPQTNKLGNNIDAARKQYGLQYSPALDLYSRVTTVDPSNIFGALDRSTEGYNINNPLTKYDDAYSQGMINFGDAQLAAYTDAMVNPSGPGQRLMQYGV